MKAPIRGLALVATVIGMCVEPAMAAQHMMPTKIISIRSPGGDVTRRKLVYVGVDGPGSTTVVVGNPATGGAKLRVHLASGGDQCFDLPASGWQPLGTVGFKYRAPAGPGAVVAALLKKTAFAGTFIVKAKAVGRTGSISVLPAPGTTSFATNFSIGGGDQYCSGGATPPGSPDTDKLYKAKRVPAPTTCSATACP
jgi:hypothetical protein